MIIKIEDKEYSYVFLGDREKKLCPSLYNYGVSEKDLSEREIYDKAISKYDEKYNDKMTIIGWWFSFVIGAIVICLYYNSIIAFLVSICLFPLTPFVGAIVGYPIAFLVIKLFIKKPVKPKNYEKVINYVNDLNKFKKDLSEQYKRKYLEIENANYDFNTYGAKMVQALAVELESFANFQNEIIKQENRKREQEYWFSLDPFEFEKEVAEWFKQQGYQSKVTKKSGDGGVDIIISKDNYTAYVQCKRYTKSKVDRPTLQALYGAVCADKVSQGIVVCLLGITKESVEFANKVGIKVVTINHLVKQDNLFSLTLNKKLLYTKPLQINKARLRVGTLDLITYACKTQEDATRFISNLDLDKSFKPIEYSGLFLIICCSDDNFNTFEKWRNSKINTPTYTYQDYKKRTYKRRRYW